MSNQAARKSGVAAGTDNLTRRLAQPEETQGSGNGNGNGNAFNLLMNASKKRKQEADAPKKPGPTHKGGSLNKRDHKDALANYIVDPAKFEGRGLIYYDDHFVAINDAFPKGTVHTLLLPRDLDLAARHPLDALQDPAFLAKVNAEVPKLKKLAASELRRRIGKTSAADQVRRDAMNADPPPKDLPPGRDWEDDLEVGVHAGPSMNHLHLHVMSKEYMGTHGKSGRHYNTFKSGFFVKLDEFPLDDPQARLDARANDLAGDLVCWRCEKSFGRSWKSLEAHLQDEFEDWRSR